VSNPGQFRFTPPTHVVSSFYQALLEHEEEGGVRARGNRYYANQRLVSDKMRQLGFELYIDPKIQGCCVTTFMEPTHPKFNFDKFYNFLAHKGIVIYPGKLTQAQTFRIGSIGEIHEEDILELIEEIKNAFKFMGIELPLTINVDDN
jgi:2-aminoethylphosphonate-pyruvate transaminase